MNMYIRIYIYVLYIYIERDSSLRYCLSDLQQFLAKPSFAPVFFGASEDTAVWPACGEKQMQCEKGGVGAGEFTAQKQGSNEFGLRCFV